MAKNNRLGKAGKVALVPPSGKGLVRVAPASVKRYEAAGFRKEGGGRKGRRATPANTTKETPPKDNGDGTTPKEQ